MSVYLGTHSQVLALLQEAKENIDLDGPRLVLADFLEDHGDPDRAEFIRLGCRLARELRLDPSDYGQLKERATQLLHRHGGGWMGSLWQWWLAPVGWHRGLLAIKMPRRFDPASVADALPWIDTAVVATTGRESLMRVVRLLAAAKVNHLCLDLRTPVRENTLLEILGTIPPSGCLRSLSFDWPLGLLRNNGDEPVSTPAVSPGFFSRLLRKLALGRHLTHLGSSPRLDEEQTCMVCKAGVEPASAENLFWMHQRPPADFVHRSSARRRSLLPKD